MGERLLNTKLESDSDQIFFCIRVWLKPPACVFCCTCITGPGSLISRSIADCVTRDSGGSPAHGCEERPVYIGNTKRMSEWSQAPGGRVHEPRGINQQLIGWLLGEGNAKSKEMHTCLKKGLPVTGMAEPHLKPHLPLSWWVYAAYSLVIQQLLTSCLSSPISLHILCSKFHPGPQLHYNPICLKAFAYVHTVRNSPSCLPR